MLLYRFVDLAGFIGIVSNRQMYLRQVKAWLDPYETDAFAHLVAEVLEKTDLAIIDPSPAKSAKVTELREMIRETLVDLQVQSIYAQSWSQVRESDALWRIYSPDTKGIRLTVESDCLLSAIKTKWPAVDIDHFEVEYCSREDACTRLRDRFSAGGANIQITSCCRYKRLEFRHEEEYRFCMFQSPEGYEAIDLEPFDLNDEGDLKTALSRLQGYLPDNIKDYKFDPALIQEVTLDPRLDPKKDRWFVQAIYNLCNDQKIAPQVTQSNLYRLTP